jgi:RNA polymerase II subunit A-like phosphatase
MFLCGNMEFIILKIIFNRPGLHNFLREISRKYEMHIYTMGTRSYAEAVVREIDPDGTLFQDRILSRDENGSMTEKRLERLFPSDTSRVLVLDDRADVWNYSNNLIQIKPYEYFIGIGDINSPFAQPKTDIIPSADELSQSTTNSAINTTTSTTDNVNNTTTATAVDNNESSESSVTTTKIHVNGASNNDQNDTVDNEESSTTNGEVKEQNGVVSTSESKEDSVDEKENKEEAKDDIYSDDEDDDSDSKTPRPPSIGLSISNNSLDSIATKKRKGKEKEQITPNAISSNSNTEHDSATHLPNTHDTDDILRVIRRVSNHIHFNNQVVY